MASVVAVTYARAIFEVAKESSQEVQTLEQLKFVEACFSENKDLLRILCTPSIPKKERLTIVQNIFENALTSDNLSFIMLLIEKDRIKAFSSIIKEYVKQYYKDNNICEAVVTTAIPLNEDNKEKLAKRLSEVTGKKVLITTKIDSTCLAGVIVDIDGERMDGSVRGKIDTIAKSFLNHSA